MSIKVIDDSSYKDESLNWDRIVHSFDPELEMLPDGDKRYFTSIVYWLINKEPALSNIPPAHMFAYIIRADWILDLKSYPMYVNEEYVRKQIAKLLHRYKIRLSENALAWLYGPLSHTKQHVKQEIIQPVQKVSD